MPQLPVVVVGGCDSWPARTKWTPDLFTAEFGQIQVTFRSLVYTHCTLLYICCTLCFLRTVYRLCIAEYSVYRLCIRCTISLLCILCTALIVPPGFPLFAAFSLLSAEIELIWCFSLCIVKPSVVLSGARFSSVVLSGARFSWVVQASHEWRSGRR